jgi:hypothetical protein
MRRARRTSAAVAVATILSLAALTASGTASGGDVRVVVGVKPGPLMMSVGGDSLVGSGLHRITITVTDARGSGAGWRLEATPSRASTGTVTLVGVETRCGKNSTCTLPQAPAAPSTRLAAGQPTPVLTAWKGEGMGRVEIHLTVAASSASSRIALAFSLHAG